MDQKSMPILKSEAISPQSQPSTSHPSPAYRDFFLPGATPAYQHPMHGFFTG
ncbi:unnamed protein product [Toxocara canis]|nr:unnamed protein product [Toxocara canis]